MMEGLAKRVANFLAEYPEVQEDNERIVSQWPPMSREAAELWQAAKLNYLRQQQELEAKEK